MFKHPYLSRNNSYICGFIWNIMEELDSPVSYFKERVAADQTICASDDILLANCEGTKGFKRFRDSCRINAFIALYCKKNSFKCRINFEEFVVSEGTMIMSMPNNSICFSDENGKNADMILIVASTQFFSSHKLDIIKMLNEVVGVFNNPCLRLLPEESSMFEQHIKLLTETTHSEYAYAKESAYHIISSFFFLLGSFVCRQIIGQGIELQSVSIRNKLVFERFLNLVKQYHTEQRNVVFYANKLCISPKYLSKIVKSVSGFSAPQLIDRFVIRQAQQLLKNSDSCIKEISEELNFPCPSFFYKYFKKHTGMTPKQYREN